MSVELTNNCILSVLKELDPKDPTHFESFLYMCFATYGYTRGFIRSIYNYSSNVEEKLFELTKKFLDHYKPAVDALCFRIPSESKTSDKLLPFYLVLYAAAKYDIRTPALDKLSKFLPIMNDMMLALAYGACSKPGEIAIVNAELKKRIKSSNFSLKVLNMISSNIWFRSRLVRMKKFGDFEFVQFMQMDIESILATPEYNRPTLIQDMVRCMDEMQATVELIESATVAILSNKQRLRINTMCFTNITPSHCIFSKNFYRMPEYPFRMNDDDKYTLSSVDFFKSLHLLKRLNRVGVELCVQLKGILLDPKYKSIFSQEQLSWGDLYQMVSVYELSNVFDRDIWDFLEAVDSNDEESAGEDEHDDIQHALRPRVRHRPQVREVWKVGCAHSRGSEKLWMHIEVIARLISERNLDGNINHMLVFLRSLSNSRKVVDIQWMNNTIERIAPMLKEEDERMLRRLIFESKTNQITKKNFEYLVSFYREKTRRRKPPQVPDGPVADRPEAFPVFQQETLCLESGGEQLELLRLLRR